MENKKFTGNLNEISYITIMVAIVGSGIANYHSFSNSQVQAFQKEYQACY